MYVDSVYIKHFQEVAQLISPMTTAPMSGCLSFYYQLQQGNDNSFTVYTRDVAGVYEEIWKMGNPGNAAWNLAEMEFSAPYPMEVGVLGGLRALAWLLYRNTTQTWAWSLETTVLHSSFLFFCVSISIFLFPFLAFSSLLPSSVFPLFFSFISSFSWKNFLKNKDKHGKGSQPTRFHDKCPLQKN